MRNREDLRPSQIKVLNEIKASKGLQVVLPMGSGKTATAITAIRDMIDDKTIRCAIVLAPVRVALTTWPDEIKKWSHLADTDMVVLKGGPAKRKALLKENHEIYVCSIDNIVALIEDLREYPATDRRWHAATANRLLRPACWGAAHTLNRENINGIPKTTGHRRDAARDPKQHQRQRRAAAGRQQVNRVGDLPSRGHQMPA